MVLTELYSRILGLSDPYFVADVELDTAGGRVDVLGAVRLVAASGLVEIMPNLGCGVTSIPDRPVHDLPCVGCPEHGALQVRVPSPTSSVVGALDLYPKLA